MLEEYLYLAAKIFCPSIFVRIKSSQNETSKSLNHRHRQHADSESQEQQSAQDMLLCAPSRRSIGEVISLHNFSTPLIVYKLNSYRPNDMFEMWVRSHTRSLTCYYDSLKNIVAEAMVDQYG
ncbi:unnamed protein product [Arabis nemorensis]|uniref:Uncharacterized protein n=1 Tax=Arabis nemorensis TaxID=586526 RepID=A0A565BST2_9BRAS|nr:unnamed protein product [Arabis nemorensis]